MEEKATLIKQDINNDETKIEDLPEPEITENELEEIITFINNWDYQKYERDSEVREALLLLRTKMKKEEEEKAKSLEELRLKEKNEMINNTNINPDIENEIKNENENDIYIREQSNNSNNKINVELSEKEKELLEKNWNSSTKPEYGERIVNEKGDKEIIINNDKKMKKVNIYCIIYIMLFLQKNKQIYKNIDDIIYTKPVLVPSSGKFISI